MQNREIEIRVYFDGEFEHHAYCNSIDDAIEELKRMKGEPGYEFRSDDE